MRGDLARQRAARDMRQRDQRIVDRVRREVDEASLQRPVLLDGALAREAPVDIVVRAEHGGDAREDFGLVPLDPSKLGGDELLIDAIAGLGEKGLLVDLGAKLVDFRRRSARRFAGCWASAGARPRRGGRRRAACRSRRPRRCRLARRRSRAKARARFRRRCSTIAPDLPPPNQCDQTAGRPAARRAQASHPAGG